ncbi:hypothetical protein BDB00DRAFT_821569 [Zychaea mexicana]|uniref:uncharacterized protein n=1 Tax=Zychaea mexicana TaxID=64656 RepID=UPI0022FDC482|nr:uncharacterized protein BDB00DRAFT_821569 [Zychaea mexicana]KAI9493765.1 hypothetical protein BDB00DRAFT_821569 [Zychaea mexicana]
MHLLPKTHFLPNMTATSRLTDDCLELIFFWCGSCPIVLCTLAKVCKRWHAIARRPVMWRRLTLDKPVLFSAYKRLLVSPSLQPQLESVRHLNVAKPYETLRHSHLSPLPLSTGLRNVRALSTKHLCLGEIHTLTKQLPLLHTLDSDRVETWCAIQPLDVTDLLLTHPLQHVNICFGHVSGFITIVAKPLPFAVASVQTLSIVNMRDADYFHFLTLVTEIALLEQEAQEQVYYGQGLLDDEEGGAVTLEHMIVSRWKALESKQADKYAWIAQLPNLRHLKFGFCYAWPAAVWRGAVLPQCPKLESLTLYGWTRLNPPKQESQQQLQQQQQNQWLSIQEDAEQAIVACFAAMGESLKTLTLDDFWVSGRMKLATRKRAHVILRNSSELLRDGGRRAERILNDMHDFIVVNQPRHDITVHLDAGWKTLDQQWLDQRE